MIKKFDDKDENKKEEKNRVSGYEIQPLIIPENYTNLSLKPGLYIVPTPIGNLDDITLRAIKILQNADIIACEDTRHTGNLLKQYKIPHKRLESYHEYNEAEKAETLVEAIKQGKSVALVTDAGTPGISDPGFRIINSAISANIFLITLPGPVAFIPALVASGFPTNNFKFWGFAPQKKGRQTFLKTVLSESSTSIMYESTHRLVKLIDELLALGESDRQICIAREISKIYEEYIRCTVDEANKLLKKKQLKGEFVIVIKGK